jgi:hypothetical protein
MSAINYIVIADSETIYCAYYTTNVYFEKSIESIIVTTLSPNEQIRVTGFVTTNDGVEWCVANHMGIVVYVEKERLYQYRPSMVVEIYRMQTTVTHMGDDIMLYTIPDEEGVISSIKDGVLVEVLGEAGIFTRIKLDGNIYYVKTINITSSVTYYQKLAITISLVCIVSILCVFLLIVFVKRQAKKENQTEL